MLGRHTISLVSLVALGAASFLGLWGLGLFDLRFGGLGSEDDLLRVARDAGLVLAATFAALSLSFAVLSVVLALVLRLPFVAAGGRRLARKRVDQPELDDGRLARGWCRLVRELGFAAHWLVGYDLVVEDFAPTGAASAAAQVVAVGTASGEVVPADPYGQLSSEASTVAAAVRATLGDSGLPTAPGGVDFVRGASGAGPVLDAVSDAMRELPQMKWLAPLLRLGRTIMPREAYVLHGELMPTGSRGHGLVLVLAERGAGVIQSDTLLEQTFDPALGRRTAPDQPAQVDALYRLGAGAAAWTLCHLLEIRNENDALDKLGTRDWHSYAYFRTGVLCHEAGHPEKGQALYARALERDPENQLALFNLASIDAANVGRDGQSTLRSGAAIARFERLGALIDEQQAKKDWKRPDPLWFQTAYKLGASRLEQVTKEHEDGSDLADDPQIEQAYADVRTMLIAVETELDELPGLRPRSIAEARRGVLKRVEEPSLVLLADLALARRRGDPELTPERSDEKPRKQLIACLCAAARKEAKVPRGNVPWLAEFIVDRYLGDADEHKRRSRRARLSYRARYNLACYYTRVASMTDPSKADDRRKATAFALEELGYGVEAGSLAEWATRDPALRWLRHHDKAGFENVVVPYLPATTTTEAATPAEAARSRRRRTSRRNRRRSR